jgi:hypothetical protein
VKVLTVFVALVLGIALALLYFREDAGPIEATKPSAVPSTAEVARVYEAPQPRVATPPSPRAPQPDVAPQQPSVGSESSRREPAEGSPEAVFRLAERNGLLRKFNISTGQAHVDPLIWSTLDYDVKKFVTLSFAKKAGGGVATAMSVRDVRTDKQLAHINFWGEPVID